MSLSSIVDPSKTILPPLKELNYKDESYSGCMLSEVIPFGCTCGIDFTIRGYDIAIDFARSHMTFDQIATKYKLNGCCRMRLLSPYTTNIVSMDINSKVNDDKVEGIVTEDIPAPQGSLFVPSEFHPPSLA